MLTMLNRLLHTIFFFALVASASAQNPYLQGSLSGTGAPGTKTRSPLNSMERAANSLAGATILTDTFGNQRLALFVHVEDTCINYTPDTTGNTANLSAFVEKCGTDSVWYIDWTGRSVFLGSSGGSVCDQDWLQISDNSCPDTIVDSIYHYKYAAIGARLVWPTAEFLVSDSVGVGIQVISGSRNARLVFYDNNNVKYSTIDQSGASTIWYMQPTGSEWRIATAAGGTPENPSGPFVNQFAVNPPDAPLPTVQAHQYPNTRMDTNTIRNFIYTDGVGKFRSQAIDTLIQIVVDSIAGDTALQNNWYVRDGTTTDLIRTATLDSAAQWLTDDGWIYFQAGALAGGRAYIDADESSIFFGDLGGVNTVEVNTTGIDITTSATASRAIDLTTDTVNTQGSFSAANFRLNFLSTNSYLFADSVKIVGIGQFPAFPGLAGDGTDKGFLYDIGNGGVFTHNGDGTTGGISNTRTGATSFDVYTQQDVNNLTRNYYSQSSFSDASNVQIQVIAENSPYTEIKVKTIASDNENLFGALLGDEKTKSLYFGSSTSGSDIYTGATAFGIRSVPNPALPFDWFQILLPQDSLGNQISMYNRAYYWKNEHPTGAAGDTLFHFWAATGAGGEAGSDPGFMTLDDIRGPNFGENIYNTDDFLKNGGTTVGLDSGSLKFNLATTVANPYGLELTGSNTTTTNRFMSFKTEADSLRFQEFAGEYYMITNTGFQNNVSDQYRTLADSVQWIEGTVQTNSTSRYVLGMTPSGWMKRFDGAAANAGDVINSNGTDWRFSSPTSLGYILQNGNSFGAAMTIGTNDNNAVNVEVNGTTGLTMGTDYNLTATASVATTNSATDRLIIQTNSTGTAANSFGSGILLRGESNTTDNRDMSQVQSVWISATDASRTANLIVKTAINGTLTEVVRFFGNTIPQMTIGNTGASYFATSINAGSSTYAITSSNTANPAAMNIACTGNNTSSSAAFGGATFSTTSGTKYDFRWPTIFAPTSGTGSFYNLTVNPTINQTGGANGLTGGIIFEPTLTAVGATWSALAMATSNTSAKFLNQTGANTTSTHVGAFGIGSTTVPTDKLEVTGNVALLTAGNKLKIATGANASAGVSAAMTAGSITINTTAVTANSLIFLTHATLGGTQGILSVGTITAGTSFVINSSSATDTGTVNWLIIN